MRWPSSSGKTSASTPTTSTMTVTLTCSLGCRPTTLARPASNWVTSRATTPNRFGHWHREFPDAPSYSRVVQLLPRVLWPLVHYLGSRRGEVSGISFVDSTPLKVCHHARIHSHKVFQGLAQRGKSSTGWFFGFKLHLIINDRSELLGVRLTPGNVDDRLPVPERPRDSLASSLGIEAIFPKRYATPSSSKA